MEQKTTKEMIIKGLENWTKNHEYQDLTLDFSAVVELLECLKENDIALKEQEEKIVKLEEANQGLGDALLDKLFFEKK